MIDRCQLRYFLAVADQGNFSRAAARCNVTQPTLSVGIAKLERDIGAQLFIRNNRRVQLTQAGNRLLAHARRIENEFNLAASAVQDSDEEPALRLGVLRSFPGSTIAQAMSAMHRNAPAAKVELVDGTERELANHLARRRIDCALTLVGRGKDRFVEQPLFEEGYSLAVSLTHPAAQASEVEADQVAEDMMIVRRHCEVLSETSRYFTQRGVRPHFVYRSVNDERTMQLVASGLAVTVMPDCYQAPDIARPKLAGFDFRRTIGFAFQSEEQRETSANHAALRALQQLLRSQSPG